jgi:hypothetical protein
VSLQLRVASKTRLAKPDAIKLAVFWGTLVTKDISTAAAVVSSLHHGKLDGATSKKLNNSLFRFEVYAIYISANKEK